MAGTVDRHDRGAIAETARPLGDLFDVEHRVGGIDGGVVARGEDGPFRPQDQRRHADVEPVVQLSVAAPDRAEPPEPHREPGERLPVEVVLPCPVGADVQARSVGVELLAGEGSLARHPAERVDRRRRAGRAQQRRSLQVEPRAVEDESRHTRARRSAGPALEPVEPQRQDQSARRVRDEEYLSAADLFPDQAQCLVEFRVVELQVRHEVRGLTRTPGAAAFAQVEGEEGVALLGEMLGDVLLEEVVGEPVDVQHRAVPRQVPGLVADQRGLDVALPVRIGTQRDRQLLVAVAEDVGSPSSHDHTLLGERSRLRGAQLGKVTHR